MNLCAAILKVVSQLNSSKFDYPQVLEVTQGTNGCR
jgi:hypothetical protein